MVINVAGEDGLIIFRSFQVGGLLIWVRAKFPFEALFVTYIYFSFLIHFKKTDENVHNSQSAFPEGHYHQHLHGSTVTTQQPRKHKYPGLRMWSNRFVFEVPTFGPPSNQNKHQLWNCTADSWHNKRQANPSWIYLIINQWVLWVNDMSPSAMILWTLWPCSKCLPGTIKRCGKAHGTNHVIAATEIPPTKLLGHLHSLTRPPKRAGNRITEVLSP